MNVLSLFDGMSCGMIALDRLGIPVENYYASEVDKYAIQVSKANWPNIIHVGDVTKLKIPKSHHIDLLIGGSPCQGFSFAGKQLNFDDPRSKLFFEFVRLLKEIRVYNPDVLFLLENVVMKKEYQNVITEHLGVEPVLINSALVSAQNRKRLYWTNIPLNIKLQDKGILLRDILEKDGNGIIINRGQTYPRNNKSMCIDANYHKGADNNGQRTMIEQIESETKREFDISIHKNGNIRPHKLDPKKSGISEIGTIVHPDNKCVTHIASYVPNVLEFKDNYVQFDKSSGGHESQYYRAAYPDNKQPTISSGRAEPKVMLSKAPFTYRKLTVTECERLQTVPDGYTSGVSDTQRYRMLGNGWTIDVIAHIFSSIPIASQHINKQSA